MQRTNSQLIQISLAEDAAFNDLTGQATIASDATGSARITAKAEGVLSGITLADEVFAAVDPAITRNWLKADGDKVSIGDPVCELTGPLRSLLAAERTALNFMQHLSGIATATHHFVEAVEGTDCSIADTRKTTPGLRRLEKQAVIHGGGINHRMDLESGILIKENHIQACGSITDAVLACGNNDQSWIEVECETSAEVVEAVSVCPDIILIDNVTPDTVGHARSLVPDSILLEASGNVTLSNARSYADTGIGRIAIGAITHSSSALDLSMRISSTL